MKKLKLVLIIVAVFSLSPTIIHAHEGLETEEAETIEARTERFERVKTAYPVRLNEKEQSRLASRCVKAQTNLAKIHDRLEVRAVAITKRYDLIELHLTAVQKRLSLQEIDTSIIDLLLSNFQKLTTQYDTALLDYQNALDDATLVGCTAEPSTFKALLEEVRAKRQVFVSSVEDIKDFTKGELKTTFDALRARLKSRSDES